MVLCRQALLLKNALLCTYTSLSMCYGSDNTFIVFLQVFSAYTVAQSPDLILLLWSLSHYVWPSSLPGRGSTSAEVVGTGRGEGLEIGLVGTQEDRLEEECTGASVKIFEEL